MVAFIKLVSRSMLLGGFLLVGGKGSFIFMLVLYHKFGFTTVTLDDSWAERVEGR
jgi:hypothetical protein